MTVVRYCDDDQLCGCCVRVADAKDPAEALLVGVFGGDELGSPDAPAANQDFVPGRSKSPGQTTTLRPGPTEDSDLHADVRRRLTE
jgi:hypothetical protein